LSYLLKSNVTTSLSLPHLPRERKKNKSINKDSIPAVDRAYGHKFLTNQMMISLTLGSVDTRRKISPTVIDESKIPKENRAASYSLAISPLNATGETVVIDLPIRDTIADRIQFYADNIQNVIVRFDLVPTYGSSKKMIGRASVSLSHNENSSSIYHEKGALGGSFSVPILSSYDLDSIGMIIFEYIVVRPFKHRNMTIDTRRTYWKAIETQVIGHRGLGANRQIRGHGNLQLGENTVLSFVTAASLGAQYVEFGEYMCFTFFFPLGYKY